MIFIICLNIIFIWWILLPQKKKVYQKKSVNSVISIEFGNIFIYNVINRIKKGRKNYGIQLLQANRKGFSFRKMEHDNYRLVDLFCRDFNLSDSVAVFISSWNDYIIENRSAGFSASDLRFFCLFSYQQHHKLIQ